MSKSNKKVEEKEAKVLKYSKKELILNSKFVNRKDILNVLLKDEGSYTFEEVDELLNKFYERKVN